MDLRKLAFVDRSVTARAFANVRSSIQTLLQAFGLVHVTPNYIGLRQFFLAISTSSWGHASIRCDDPPS